jgi:hypothetical protein
MHMALRHDVPSVDNTLIDTTRHVASESRGIRPRYTPTGSTDMTPAEFRELLADFGLQLSSASRTRWPHTAIELAAAAAVVAAEAAETAAAALNKYLHPPVSKD